MKTVIERKSFIDALSMGGSMSGKTRSIPILEMSKITIKGNSVVVSSFDGEVAISTRCDIVSSEGDNVFCINTRDLLAMLKSLKDDQVTLDLNDNACVVIHNKGQFELAIVDSSDFPTPSKDSDSADSATISLDSSLLYDWARVCKNFISQDDLRPILGGMYLYCMGSECGCVATDTHKMYWDFLTSDTFVDINCDGVVTSKALDVLIGMVANGGDVNVTFGSHNIVFKTQNTKMLCRKVEGKFPSFRSVVPSVSANHCVVSVDDMRDAIARLNLMSGATRLIKINMTSSKMNIETCDLDFSKQGNEDIVCTLDGSSATIGVNGVNMLTCVNALRGDKVCIDFETPQRAMVIREDNATLLIMPMRIV